MNRSKFYMISVLSVISFGLLVGQDLYSQNLGPADYQKKIDEFPTAPVVDVRTPGEFNSSRLKNAMNIDISSNSFANLINKLDKNKPVFVYCLSGSRSSYATRYMREQGFKTVYDLTGGLIKWRAARLPENSGSISKAGEMSLAQYNNLLITDKLVLVDIYADWCAPCKKMAPSLEEIKKEMENSVTLVRINADQNKTLVSSLKVSALPTLLLYKNKKLIWSNEGFLSKSDIISHLVK